MISYNSLYIYRPQTKISSKSIYQSDKPDKYENPDSYNA